MEENLTAETNAGATIAESTEPSAQTETVVEQEQNKTETEPIAEQNEVNPKPKQTKEENAEYARKRRESEQATKIKEAEANAIIDALGGINPYTKEKMVDDADVSEWKRMREIERNGGDPMTDYLKKLKEEQRKKAEEETRQQEQQRWIAEDRQKFTESHPEVDLSVLIQDESFREYSNGKIGTMPLSSIYESYKKMLEKIEQKYNKQAAQAIATSKATPGSISTPGSTEQTYYTPEQVRAMTREEMDKNWSRIQESRKRW